MACSVVIMVNWGKDGAKGKRLSFWSKEDRRQNAREISKTTSTAGGTVDHINRPPREGDQRRWRRMAQISDGALRKVC